MAIESQVPALVSLIAIALMILTLIIGYIRKITMTYVIILANLLVFALWFFSPDQIISDLGFQPLYLISLQDFPKLYTLFTSMFVHAGFLHILGNMFVFFFMGVAFEQRIGRKKFLIIYLITGVFAALTQSLVDFGSSISLVGASGAIFGILGAFAYSYPRDEVVMPVPIGIMIIMRIKVIYATIIFAALETVVVIFSVNDNTAHFAHLGGLISGVILAALLVGNQGAKLKKTEGMKQYTTAISKSDTIDIAHLQPLASTAELQSMIQRIEHENVRQVRDIWLDHFLERISCPVCHKPLNHFNRKIWCEENHFRTDY